MKPSLGCPLQGSQHNPRRRAVASAFGNLHRQTDQLVVTRRDLAEVQSFDNHHIVREQSEMSAVIPGVKLLNREIIRPYEFHSTFDQFLSGFGQEVREVLAKSFVPEARIPRVKQNAFRLVETAAGEKARTNLSH